MIAYPGLSQQVFERYPFSDVYKVRKATKVDDVPGTITTFTPAPGASVTRLEQTMPYIYEWMN